ncbi:RecT family recombinase [Pseudomonas fluorescens]|uniref:Gifsy-1 prophage protein n=1 Tax=Pseudomonas fluorescens TaxID=294 RepID=A0A0F4TB10_PSEFL|nr:RecT family recombinase [Pseudomonas fluorescens]KJZ41613.1 gifsy-1 prophage protein [Pseudomonas fluorescens]
MTDSDTQATTGLATYHDPSHNAAALILDPGTMRSMTDLATMMADGKTTVPEHLRGNKADCMAIVLQAMQWQMNPFAVAQKTFIVKGGALSYEAQLVNAVITSKAPTIDRLHYDWFGPWEKIVGKFLVKKNAENKEYRVPGWGLLDEVGLGVRVWATFRGEDEPRVLETLMAQARTRNSTLWADDPKQQIAYLATKKWARLFCPDVILGVYTPDEFEGSYGNEIDITPTEQTNNTAAASSVSFGPKSPSPEIDGVFADLLAVAKQQDIDAYAAAWAGLKPKQRAAIGLECHEALKNMAATVDGDFTDMTGNNDGLSQVEEAA